MLWISILYILIGLSWIGTTTYFIWGREFYKHIRWFRFILAVTLWPFFLIFILVGFFVLGEK